MSDLISRKEMLRAVDSLGEDLISYYKLLRLIWEMPSAEPERKWIPVTEALPEDNADVLVQFKSNMAVGYYEDDEWSIVTGDNLCCGIDDCEEKPIAWMQLPEPWRGEE